MEIVDPANSPKFDEYASKYYEMRKRKGVTRTDARNLLQRRPIDYGMMMVHTGDADGLVAGLTQHYPETIRPALQIIKPRPGISVVAGMYMLIFKNDVRFISDATVNFDPTAEQLADIAILTAEKVRSFDIEPRIAMLSFSNFGSTRASVRAEDGPCGRAREAPCAGPDGRRRNDGRHGRVAGDPRERSIRSARSRGAPTC